MAFEGGPISLVGVVPALTQAASLGLSQVFQGSGQSFFAGAGQALAGQAVNVALNSVFGSQVTGPNGVKLDSGSNLLATSITPFIKNSVAAGINQSIQQSLESSGPFGPVLSSSVTSTAKQLFGGSGSAVARETTGTNFGNKTFPGAGSEPPADYAGGKSYTLGSTGGDVVFSIQPANQGPQATGLSQSTTFPTTITTLPFNQLSEMPPLVPNATADAIKQGAMSNAVGQKAFSTNLSGSFNTSLSLV